MHRLIRSHKSRIRNFIYLVYHSPELYGTNIILAVIFSWQTHGSSVTYIGIMNIYTCAGVSLWGKPRCFFARTPSEADVSFSCEDLDLDLDLDRGTSIPTWRSQLLVAASMPSMKFSASIQTRYAFSGRYTPTAKMLSRQHTACKFHSLASLTRCSGIPGKSKVTGSET